jgi:hypothetical protein
MRGARGDTGDGVFSGIGAGPGPVLPREFGLARAREFARVCQ